MIVIEAAEIKSGREELFSFLKRKLNVEIKVDKFNLILDTVTSEPSPKLVKTYLKRFLHSKDLSALYRVTEKKGVVRIVKRNRKKPKRSRKKKELKPSSHTTLPYYYPNYP